MACDWSFLPGAISAASGLVGVWLGGHLTWKRDALREAERVRKESAYLAILVVAHLDRFVKGCMFVALDDGTEEGRPAGDDGVTHVFTCKAPTFDPLALHVDWKVLPADLMYGILNLPYKAEQLENRIGGAWEDDDPQDRTELFWTRRHGYAELGLEVSDLVRKLRMHAELPLDVRAEGEWNRDEVLREQMVEIEKKRAEYEARVAASHIRMPDL